MKPWFNLLFTFFLTICCFHPDIRAQWVKSNGPWGTTCYSMAVKGSAVFTGTPAGVYVSRNNGISWTTANAGIRDLVTWSLAVSGTRLFAGTYSNGVYVSTNDGASWFPKNNGLSNMTVYTIAVNGSNIFAGTGGGGVFLTTDNGANWTAMNNGLTNFNIHTLKVDGSNLYAGTGGGMFLSTDNGGSWNAINSGLTGWNVWSFVVHGSNLFAGTWPGGVFRSTDNGSNWNAANTGFAGTNVRSLFVNGTYIFAGTQDSGAFRSSDDGASWTRIDTGLTDHYVWSFEVNGAGLFAGTDGGGVCISTDYGANWTGVDSGLTYSPTRAIIGHGTNLFAATWGGGVFISGDGGKNWVPTKTGLLDTYVTTLLMDGSNFFAGTLEGVYLSTNNGTTWTLTDTGIAQSDVRSLILNGSKLYAGTYGQGVFVSTDNGSSWGALKSGLTDTNVQMVSFYGKDLYAGTYGSGVFRSTDNGSIWNTANNGMTGLYVFIFLGRGSSFYTGTHDGGIFLTTDHGANWQSTNAGLTNTDIRSLTVNGPALFAGTYGGGVFLSTNRGASWVPVNTGLSETYVRCFMANDTALFIGTYGGCVWHRPLSEIVPRYAAISGTVFNDVNNNSVFDGGDSTIAGAKIYLRDTNNIIVDSVLSDENGYYQLFTYSGGTYTMNEILDTAWIQTSPSGIGTYAVTVALDDSVIGKNFGNIHSYRYVGGSGGSWSSGSSWQGGVVPGSGQAVTIPGGATINVDALPHDTVRALRIEPSGTLSFSSTVGQLKVLQTVQVASGATLQFPQTSDTTGLTCYNDFVNWGTITPGHSVVTFAGDKPKVIANGDMLGNRLRNAFYKLSIIGDSTGAIGNLVIGNNLSLSRKLDFKDTLIIQNPAASGLTGQGIISAGTIGREIQSGISDAYRFESESTYVRFLGSGEIPALVTMTCYPRIDPSTMSTSWRFVGGKVDTASHSIGITTSISKRRWVITIPRTERRLLARGSSDFVKRIYDVGATGYGYAHGKLSLRYDSTEVPPGMSEGALQLAEVSQPEAVTLDARWNLISVPFDCVNPSVAALFPSATSSAYSYLGGYNPASILESGKGYWLKYPSAETRTIYGYPVVSDTVHVIRGWNLVGCFTEPVTASGIGVVPAELTVSNFYSYSSASGYQTVGTLSPGKGYWVKASQDGSLILDSETSGMSKNRITICSSSELPPPPPSEITKNDEMPKEYALAQNYPNPFNPATAV